MGLASVFKPYTKISQALVDGGDHHMGAAPTALLGLAYTSHLFRMDTQKAEPEGEKNVAFAPHVLSWLAAFSAELLSFHLKCC